MIPTTKAANILRTTPICSWTKFRRAVGLRASCGATSTLIWTRLPILSPSVRKCSPGVSTTSRSSSMFLFIERRGFKLRTNVPWFHQNGRTVLRLTLSQPYLTICESQTYKGTFAKYYYAILRLRPPHPCHTHFIRFPKTPPPLIRV